MSRISIVLIAVTLSICGVAQGQNNLLGYADFESNPPPLSGNNTPYPVTPWVLVGSSQSNVVKVDGPGNYNYKSDGPESDASAPGPSTPQHYFDFVGEGSFYQSFTAPCEGIIEFGGWFSTRADQAGTGNITLRQGIGTSGAVVATIPVSLPAGDSQFDAWKLFASTTSVLPGTYSFIVKMDDNLNLDNAFVRYKTPCDIPCMTAVVEKTSCEKNGTFAVTTTVTNTTQHPVQWVLISPPPGATYTVTPNVVAANLAQNQSTSVAVTVTGATPGQQICLFYQLQDADGKTCCSVERCFNLPECACMTISKEKINCNNYTFEIKNETASQIDQLFVIPSTGSVTPQLISPLNLAPGATTTVTLHLSGVSAGQTVCLILQAYGRELTECCTIRVCIKLPRIIQHCD